MCELTMGEIPECEGLLAVLLASLGARVESNPSSFVIESVKGILSDKHFQTFMKMLE